MKAAKKPDLQKPRYRKSIYELLNKDTFQLFLDMNPEYSKYTFKQFRSVIKKFNNGMWHKIIECPNGVELPQLIGKMFIGNCKARESINHSLSSQVGKKIKFDNTKTDNYLAKIFLLTTEPRYKWHGHDRWSFKAYRTFSRTLAKEYPNRFKSYVYIEYNDLQREKLEKIEVASKLRIDQNKMLESYNEFEI